MSNPNAALGRVKLSAFVPPDSADSFLRFLSQLGVSYGYTWMQDLPEHYDDLMRLKDRMAAHGISLYNAGDYTIGKSAAIHLGSEKRDEMIGRFAKMLETLRRAGIYTTTFTWEADRVWSTPKEAFARGGAPARFVDERELEGVDLTHGRVYEKEELWGNFAYFMRKIIPVAEATGVRLALHPNDPPMPMIAGIASLITSFADYRKAFDIAGSKMLGMEFCCGCWLEGGERFGDMLAAIDAFVREGRVFVTHFRNVTDTLPVFTETFLDEGYMDMQKVMDVFYAADDDGTIIYDHTPQMEPEMGTGAATAFAIGYMKALMNTASRKVFA